MASRSTLNGVALVTGGAAGIGQETGYAFAEAGCAGVVFADKNGPGAEKAAEESKKYATNPNYRAVAVTVDVVDNMSVEAMVEQTIKEFGRIDYSVNSAGIPNLSSWPVSELDLEHLDRILDVNVKGTVHCIRAVSKVMSKQEPLEYKSVRHGTRTLGRGCIVNLASGNGVAALPGMLSYTASKHAVVGVTKTSALDNLANGIRVNTVCPAWVDTPMMQNAIKRVPQLTEVIKRASPIHRMASPDEVADAVLFLCSPGATYINGASLLIDAGLTIGSARV